MKKKKEVKAMYRLNILSKNVLITPDEVINQASTKHTIDHRTLMPHIIIAEERFVRPALGYDFYQSLISEKNRAVTADNKSTLQASINSSIDTGEMVVLQEGQIVNSSSFLSSDNQKLWTEGLLWKLVAEAVMIMAFPDGFVQFGSEGVVHNKPVASPIAAGSELTPELRTVKWMMDKKLADRIDPLREAMHQWLCKAKLADKSKYPLYCKECDCNADGIAYKRKSEFIIGVYDDD
jgi:hypothetical protein